MYNFKLGPETIRALAIAGITGVLQYITTTPDITSPKVWLTGLLVGALHATATSLLAAFTGGSFEK
jgi:uncharacterized membrane protein